MHDSCGPDPESPFTVEVISSEEGVAGLEDDWNRLSASTESPNVFMTYSWYRAWTRRLISDNGFQTLQPHVLLIRQEGSVVGIAPLVRRVVSRFGIRFRKLEFATFHSDYNDFVVGKNLFDLTCAAIDNLSRSAQDWDLLDLMELRDTRHLVEALETVAPAAKLQYRLFTEPDGCLYFPINAPWSETKKNKHLRFARRAMVQFEQRAEEGFRTRVVDQPQLENDLLNRIIGVEAQKRVGGKLSAPFIGAYPEVFKSLFNTLGPQGYIAIVLVEKNDKLVAYRILFRCGAALWDYQTAYDQAHSTLSSGTILICAAIDYGFEHEFAEFNFLRGMDTYKQRWTQEFRRNSRMLLWNRRLKSTFFAHTFMRLHASLKSSTK